VIAQGEMPKRQSTISGCNEWQIASISATEEGDCLISGSFQGSKYTHGKTNVMRIYSRNVEGGAGLPTLPIFAEASRFFMLISASTIFFSNLRFFSKSDIKFFSISL
jgi:hypothetical protein